MATRMFDRRPAVVGDPHQRVAAIVARHGELLTRVARGYSLCADDAEDAVQRALEIYMRRVESLDPATELAWLKVVTRGKAPQARPSTRTALPHALQLRGRRPSRIGARAGALPVLVHALGAHARSDPVRLLA